MLRFRRRSVSPREAQRTLWLMRGNGRIDLELGWRRGVGCFREGVDLGQGLHVLEAEAARVRSHAFGTYFGCGGVSTLASERGFSFLSKNACTAARIMSVLNSGLPWPAPAIL